MSLFLPLLFAGSAGLVLFITWKTIAQNLLEFRSLRMQLAQPQSGGEVMLTYHPIHGAIAPLANARLSRPRRHYEPKRVTHRLHHYQLGVAA